MKRTFKFNGYNLRLDQIRLISPLYSNTTCLDEWLQIFIKESKQSMRSQYNFIIYFVGRGGGYQEFYSKTIDYVGWGNFKGDEEFEKKYNESVLAWENYHNSKN